VRLGLEYSGKGNNMMSKPKTLIGVLASHDDSGVNKALVELFNWLADQDRAQKKMERFHFLCTGGTTDRIIRGTKSIAPISDKTLAFLKKSGVTKLPPSEKGGVPVLSHFVTQRLCTIVWAFWGAKGDHWLRPENLALMRLCDHWHVKRLMNSRSVQVWYEYEADADSKRNQRDCPPALILREDPRNEDWQKSWSFDTEEFKRDKRQKEGIPYNAPDIKPFANMTLALIAHDEMKSRMIEFAIDHESELRKFGSILATGTTGREVAAATSRILDKKIFRYHSGPKGGDIEIATEILYGRCDIVIFFVDPLHPQPHREDILVVFQACMVKPEVLMITNEMHAREFMTNVVRGERVEI